MDILENLNLEQKKAVTHDKGPLLIIAGAGTGKTTVITHRIAYLISQKKALPSEILALTFTDKAAEEMEVRVDGLVPYGFIDAWISTFHAFGDRILREHAIDLGLSRDFRVLTEAEQVVFVKDHFSAFDLIYYAPLGNPYKHIVELLTFFSRLKDEDISEKEFLEYAKKQVSKNKTKESEKLLEAAKAYQTYQKLMKEADNLDFGDQIILTLKLFREHPKILEKYQKQFKYVLVDEFQDTNFAQNELLKLLAKKHKNITVVGDDDQSIYKWRGAAISNILEFKNDYPRACQIVLVQNYRSGQTLLDSAYKLIRHNDPERLEIKNKINKKLKAFAQGLLPKYLHFDNNTAEADKAAKIIQEKIEKGYCYNDFAIWVRKNCQTTAFENALNYYGIPYKFTGSRGLFSRPEIRILISMMRFITNPNDSLSLFYLLTSEIYNLNIKDTSILSAEAKKINRSLYYIISNLEKFNLEISEESKEIIDKFLSDFEKMTESVKNDTVGQFTYQFLKQTGYLKRLVGKTEKDPISEVKIQNIAKFFEKIATFENISFDKSLMNFVDHLDALIEAGEDPATAEVDPDIEAVNILTIHKAKGLEFRVVFLVNLVHGSFPAQKKGEPFLIPEKLIKEKLPEADMHLAEERRLFYVGMTRAKEELYFTSAEDYGGKRLRKVSQFVLEALDLPKVDTKKIKLNSLEKIERFKKTEKFHLPLKFWDENNKKRLVLNPHQIDDYLSCPKKFEYIHVLGIPILRHHPVVYGAAVHKAIEEFFINKIRNNKVKIENLLEVFNRNWVSEGFVTQEHERKRFEQGIKTINKFFEREKNKELPQKVEEDFEFILPDLDVKIRGRYDAVYIKKSQPKADGPLAQKTEIRDFKTSEVEEQTDADKKTEQNRQLSIYALSWLAKNEILPDIVSLYFVETGVIGKVQKTKKDIEKTKEEIKKVVEGIKKNDFSARPLYGECSRCAYHDICPYTQTEV